MIRIGALALSETGAEHGGRPLLFLHGIGSSRAAFADQISHFAQAEVGCWCLAPDAPGYADSEDDLTISTLDDYVARFVRLLDEVGAPDADVVGVSWGGVIAARMAARHPDRVHRLVLADSSRGSGRDPAKAEVMRQRAEHLETIGAQAMAEARTPRLLSPHAPAELIDTVAADMAAAIRLPGYAQAAASMADTDNTDTLGLIQAPTLVLVGDADVVCPPAEAQILTDLVPTASLGIIEGAGHLANREQPVAFNRMVENFVSKQSSSLDKAAP